jgi:oxygen-independent coproporphyrinogen-3 oxidase
MLPTTSIYIHIPFCQKRCSYCDFNTYAGINHLIPAYVDAIVKEISIYGEMFDDQLPVKTIFLGGGTPTLLTTSHLGTILEKIFVHFKVDSAAEISLEANPGTVNLDYLKQIRRIGYNRISFGVQTSQVRHLNLMGRIHNFSDSIEAAKNAQLADFDNFNLDLIYGLPEQTLTEWEDTLNLILGLNPRHLSLYALGIEEGTPLWDWVQRGLVVQPDDDLAASMYELANQRLSERGYYAYEISNFAHQDQKNDWRCHHNLQYWHNQPYLGIGAGAHGFFNGKRTENVSGVGEYLKALFQTTGDSSQNPAVKHIQLVDNFTEQQETMMVGLRLVEEGVSIPDFAARFGSSPVEVFGDEIQQLLSQGLLEMKTDEFIRLSHKGRLLGNLVFQKFV